jgi:hypothetical protein
MPMRHQPKSDQALRRAVADLASLHADDRNAVLKEFDAAGQEKLNVLLKGYSDYFDEGIAENAANRHYDFSRLSPWLMQKIEMLDRVGPQITPHARRTLRECAVELFPANSLSPIPEKSGRRSFFRRRKA